LLASLSAENTLYHKLILIRDVYRVNTFMKLILRTIQTQLCQNVKFMIFPIATSCESEARYWSCCHNIASVCCKRKYPRLDTENMHVHQERNWDVSSIFFHSNSHLG